MSNMSLTTMRIFGGSRSAKCFFFDKRTHILLPNNANAQARCKNSLTKPIAHVVNKYQRPDNSIGMYGYSLLGIPFATFVLGTWQIKRWRWKLNLIEDLRQRTSTEPIDLPFDLNELKDKEYYRMRIKGKFLYEREFLIGPRSLIIDGQALSEKGGGLFSSKSNSGYYVITPFQLEDRNLTIMVNRGWIPKTARSTFKKENKITEPIEIVGIVRMSEKRPPFVPANTPGRGVWHYRDLNEMAKVAETEPVYVELQIGYGTSRGPIGGQTKVNLRNEHLSYIITWYGLSASTAYLWFRYFVQKLPLL